MKIGDDWWTSPAESESGRLVMVTGRKGVDKARNCGKYKVRVEVKWAYEPTASGMPDETTAEVMGSVNEAICTTFAKDPVAIVTGIYTGDGERTWVLYTMSTHIFGRKFNEALAPFELLPITIYCENDPDWAEYAEMRSMTEIEIDD